MTFDRPIVIIGNPGGLRVGLMRRTLAGLGAPPPRVLAYADLLAGRCGLEELPAHSIVRLESPGKDFEVERRLLMRGAAEAESEGSPAITLPEAERLEFDRGRIWCPRQWYLGFRNALRTWHAELATRDDILWTAHPADVETLFDKSRCRAGCRDGGVPVPDAVEPVACYEDLVAQMEARRWERVFVKLAHGSSASGAVAVQRHRGRLAAFTTVELVANGALRLYNRRPVRTTVDEDEIRRLIDALAPHRVHAEQWLPKASLHHGIFDLRIVVIARRARHAIVREGRSPMTNLQLGNRRGSLVELRRRIAAERWQALEATCSRIGNLYAGSLQLGVDLLLTPGLRNHFVLEVNAFGDLLPRVLHEGQTTFEAELAALGRDWPHAGTTTDGRHEG